MSESYPPSKTPRSNRRIRLLFVICLFGATLLFLSDHWSALAANLANPLRAVIGAQGVARLETVLFTVQDHFQRWQYESGVKNADPIWQVDENILIPATSATPVPSPWLTGEPVENHPSMTPTPIAPVQTPMVLDSKETPVYQPSSTPTVESTPTEWIPQAVTPLGMVEGEGIWSPYIQDSTGRTVALRTFLYPDPERPFAYTAIVAFDLTATRLNFVIGFDEPSEKGGPKGDGIIPERDIEAGILLAAFNGGFQSTHGSYGAMQNGFAPLPPQDEVATVAIYQDGTVQMGEWGSDIQWTSDMIAFRQNCRMIVHHGAVNPRVYNGSTSDWGGTIENNIVTWRSGIGLSQDGKTLYYFVGPGLNMSSLADAMLAASAYQSMQLDINSFWVHFVVVREKDGDLFSEPLLPDSMKDNIDRFLKPFPRDFFYITSKNIDQ